MVKIRIKTISYFSLLLIQGLMSNSLSVLAAPGFVAGATADSNAGGSGYGVEGATERGSAISVGAGMLYNNINTSGSAESRFTGFGPSFDLVYDRELFGSLGVRLKGTYFGSANSNLANSSLDNEQWNHTSYGATVGLSYERFTLSAGLAKEKADIERVGTGGGSSTQYDGLMKQLTLSKSFLMGSGLGAELGARYARGQLESSSATLEVTQISVLLQLYIVFGLK